MELTAGATRLTVDEAFGARISSLLVPGAVRTRAGEQPCDLQLVGRFSDTPHGWGAFPMVPWAGRVRDARLTWQGRTVELPPNKAPHAIHGTVARVPWDVVEAEEHHAVLRRDLGHDWPWRGHAEIRYDLTPTSLELRLECWNDGTDADGPMPAWIGMHPWHPRFVGGAEAELDVPVTDPATAVMVKDDEGIIDGRRGPLPHGAPNHHRIDEALAGVVWPATITWPGVARLEISSDAEYGVVFTERDEAVCVEPQTGPPDAAALGLAHAVAPGEAHVMHMTWRWSTQL
ncbi:aldose 1-epimerase [Quadrisphaera setariae]|uniref:aldose 1-epimerase n=1 Tax=Quadrisphaera setariae TaxID=2593304 RepID=UPI00164FBD3B|nr:hypothetical protein [Quadrisphaera setariae]